MFSPNLCRSEVFDIVIEVYWYFSAEESDSADVIRRVSRQIYPMSILLQS